MTNEKIRDHIRDAFLEWLAEECERRGESYAACTALDRFGRYTLVWVQTSWIAWQASRAALAVELPPACPMPEEPEEAIDDSHMDAYHAANKMRKACAASIKAAGVKVVEL